MQHDNEKNIIKNWYGFEVFFTHSMFFGVKHVLKESGMFNKYLSFCVGPVTPRNDQNFKNSYLKVFYFCKILKMREKIL